MVLNALVSSLPGATTRISKPPIRSQSSAMLVTLAGFWRRRRVVLGGVGHIDDGRVIGWLCNYGADIGADKR